MPKIETLKISDLTVDPANVRVRDERAKRTLAASLKRFGPARSIVVDKDGIVRAGNGTIEAAESIGLSEVVVVDVEPGQVVAVRRPDWSPSEATAYSIADNRTAELADWDNEALSKQLDALGGEGINLDDLGFSSDDFARLNFAFDGLESKNNTTDPGAQTDRASELQERWKVKSSQIWEIPSESVAGKSHRLLCGDSTKEDCVARVMDGSKAVLMNTDPPYGVNYAAIKNGIPGSGFEHIQSKQGDIKNDDLVDGAKLQEFLESMICAAVPHLIRNPAFYLWHPMLTQGTFFAAAAAAADILIHRQIVWVKPGFVLTRSGMYHWKHELCFYGWIRGEPCVWYGDKSQVSVWQVGRDEDSGLHHTQKPVELFSRPILNHSKRGEIVYEPFAGGGSQFVAAEQTGRLCYGIEIEPKYCAVVLERLAGMGLAPRCTQ